MNLTDYRSYRDLPPIAGICSVAAAAKLGLSIDECVRRLKRHHWAFKRLHGIFTRRLIAEPIYELKMGFSLHAHYCAEHVDAWRTRVGEMREPPLGLDVCPDGALDAFFDEIDATPTTEALLVGLYVHAVPALSAALRRHMETTNRLVDHPSFRICRFALIELDEMAHYGAECVARLVLPPARVELAGWETLLVQMLAQAGTLDGSEPAAPGMATRYFSLTVPALLASGPERGQAKRVGDNARHLDLRPQRDERFPDPFNMGVHAEVFLYDPALPPEPKPLMMYYKRLREIDVPEMMASIIAQTGGKPWQYYRDMTRQLWDEARHAMMGEVGFVRAGIDWSRLVKVNFTWSLALNTQLTPLERHAVLYFIEQGLMPKTGKRFEWETGVASGDAFSAMIQDYDWADEVLHARIGRDWYVKEMGQAKRAMDYGDECWSKVLIDWKRYREEGFTQHENWWPGLYREWCRIKGIEPDPAVLAFNITYETARADLREISASG